MHLFLCPVPHYLHPLYFQICEYLLHVNRNQRDFGIDTVDSLLGETGN